MSTETRTEREITADYFRREYGGTVSEEMIAEVVTEDLNDEQLAAIVGSVQDMPHLAPDTGLAVGGAPRRPVFDPTLVRIERHRASVTQGEVSVFYRDERLARFGDRVEICRTGSNGRDPHAHADGAICFGGFVGHGDANWIRAAEYEVNRRSLTTRR